MPTVLRLGSLRVAIYPNDHYPAHVHVMGSGNEAVFNLNCPAGPVALRENYGFAQREITELENELAEQLQALCPAWEQIHGDRHRLPASQRKSPRASGSHA